MNYMLRSKMVLQEDGGFLRGMQKQILPVHRSLFYVTGLIFSEIFNTNGFIIQAEIPFIIKLTIPIILSTITKDNPTGSPPIFTGCFRKTLRDRKSTRLNS